MVTAGRNYSVELVASPEPTSVLQNGQALPGNPVEGVPGTWSQRGSTTVVTLLPSSTSIAQALNVCR